jgi:hypothetical protein
MHRVSFSVLPPSSKKKVRPAVLMVDTVVSSPDNFCPADIHVPPVKMLGRSKYTSTLSFQAVEGQFDDISSGE